MPADHRPPPADNSRRGPPSRPAGFREYAEQHPGRINALVSAGLAMFVAVSYLAPRLRIDPARLHRPGLPAAATTLGLGAAVAVDLLLIAALATHDRAVRRGAYAARDPAALVPAVLRPFCWYVILPALAGVAVLASRVADSRGPLGFDRRVDDRVVYRLYPLRPVLSVLVQLGNPLSVAVLSALLAGVCLAVGRRRAALLALIGPPLAGALTEYVLKPLIGRDASPGGFAFPSGHTTGAVAIAAVVALFVAPTGALARAPGPLRLALALAAAVLASTVPVALIALRYHYVTDVFGGTAVALAVILTLALALDATARRRARAAGGRSA